MYILDLNLSLSDILVLQGMAIVLGIVIHFVLRNKKNLQKMIRESEEQISFSGTAGKYATFDEVNAMRPLPVKEKKEPEWRAEEEPLPYKPKIKEPPPRPAPVAPIKQPVQQKEASTDVLHSLKNSIQQQQRSLDNLLQQVDHWDQQAQKAVTKEEVEALEIQLEEKEAELYKTKQQLATAQKMAARIDDVYREFDELQQKIAALERQAKGANELAIELDEVKESYTQVKKELVRKQDKLQEAVDENQRLYKQLNETEDKLAEANLQRQQLFKKLQFVENLNNEFQQVAEANKKLQNELRRIGELESMLSMVSDERDLLLKRRTS